MNEPEKEMTPELAFLLVIGYAVALLGGGALVLLVIKGIDWLL